ncbi:MAG: alpha/beta hydrolase [Microscillaceae bacterium]|nr:alpha/beta hydrolase [Microscillaceae bacterium]MDW8459855.1 alpha/beta hydrolase [Cytophagales bacterium]
MALHYKLQLLLWGQKLRGDKPLNQLSPQEARLAYKKRMQEVDKIANFVTPVHNITKQTIEVDNGNIELRIYHPTAEPNLPICMFFHGGGFVVGDLDTYEPLCKRLASLANCIVIAADYRLAPEYSFPTAHEDCYKATLWAYQNAHTFGGNAQKIALCGDSAGGNLANAVAMMLRDRKQTIKICQQILIYPTLDATFGCSSINQLAEGYLLTREMMFWFLKQYVPENQDRTNIYLSPLFAKDLKSLPPTLIITAEYDPLKDEGRLYAQKLLQAGVPTTEINYLGMIHAFIQLPKFLRQADEAQKLIAKTLKKAFA